MSAHTGTTDEERSLEDGDRTERNLFLAKEFKHTEAGVWDVYEQIPRSVPRIPALTGHVEIIKDIPFAWKMAKDVIKIESCLYHLCLAIIIEILASPVPAVGLWFAGYYLTFVQVVINERRIDKKLLIFASAGRICCGLVQRFLTFWSRRLTFPLGLLMKEHFEKEVFSVAANLDVPTHDDKVMRGKLGKFKMSATNGGVLWNLLWGLLGLFSSLIRFATELFVLMKVIGHQPGGITFAIIYVGQGVFELFCIQQPFYSRAVVAVTNNEHYIKLAGLDWLVDNCIYRQEIVAGNLADFLKTAYNRAYAHVSGKRAQHFEFSSLRPTTFLRRNLLGLIPGSIGEVAEVIYLLKSAAHPEAIPTCLVTIMFVHAMRHGFRERLWGILGQAGSIEGRFREVREFYEICHIQNQIPDGTISFPEDSCSLKSGIAVEFRNVSFRYPDRDDFALRNVSFTVEKGQLCVIVGKNGSGKSTVLKLILRLYDPTEGTILVNGQDIKRFKLADLRENMAVLFQDYTHFPLPIKDNIALGDPRNADDEARFREAARMTGAEEFVEKMAEGFGTYLQRPISNHWGIPSEAKTRSGVKIDRDFFCEALGRGVASDSPIKLAGGQMQRLAVSRMLMRSTLSEEARVRLLLLDEPSAALDPEAEQDLFARFRKLRGEKTMIFSSHRFGQLTKPADLILYMRDSTIVESGTHEELMAREGKYAELWKLQAEAFM